MRRQKILARGCRFNEIIATRIDASHVKHGFVSGSDESGVFTPPSAEQEEEDLLGQAHLLEHVLIAQEKFDPAGLWNEHGMLERYFQLAEQNSQ